MRKIGLILLLALSLLIFCSCDETLERIRESIQNGQDENEENILPESVTMAGTVTAVNNRIELTADETQYTSGPYSVIITEETKFSFANGNTATLDDVKVGDRVEITFNGQVMLSYPAQVVAHEVVIL